MKSKCVSSRGSLLLILVSTVSLSLPTSRVEAASSKLAAARQRLAEDFEPQPADSNSSGFPPAAVLRKLCYDSAIPKFRRVSIVNAGYNPKNPGAMDFSRFDTFVGLSSINVYLNRAQTAQAECFQELVTMEIKMSTASFGELNVTIDENTRIEGLHLDDQFELVRTSQPYNYSTSGYYADLLRAKFAMLPRSITKIPSMPSTLKTRIRIIAAKSTDARVPRTDFYDRMGTIEPAYIGLSERGTEGGIPVSASILAQFTERFIEGKACPTVPLSETEAEFKSGVTLLEVAQRFYDTAVANVGCRQSLK